jgi:NAD(P)-dependent dehydrogenase (short-subunit alcohol dehydrogenase family)
MNNLEGKIAVITGVASPSAIGFGIAKRLAEEGVVSVIFDIQTSVQDRARDLNEMGLKSEAFICDLTKLDQVQQCIQQIIDKYKKIDILVNNAGKSVPPRPKFLDMTEEYLDTVMDRNFRTNFITSKAVVPYMVEKKYGKIVNISSMSGPRVVYRFSAAYAASKGAVSAFTRALSLELGEYNINVNAVLPGLIDVHEPFWTPESDKMNFAKTHPALKWPIHTPGFPEDVANTVLFLASDASRYITGQEILVDGGATLVEPAPSPEDIEFYSPTK